ncbi:hypothetical protein VKT23_007453 [Stygiomarasmius scandens]|uniref:Uncharacterized protein n=1 Tax=Marasmiellus scandens TaxID=2682957 RepID=A0ABR1JMF6_9AGAR
MKQTSPLVYRNLDNIITGDVKKKGVTYTRILIRKKRQNGEYLCTSITIILTSSPPKWDPSQIFDNITLSRFLQAENTHDQTFLAPILGFKKRLEQRRIVPTHVHKPAEDKETGLYKLSKTLVGDDWGKFYLEEPVNDPPPQPAPSSPPASSPVSTPPSDSSSTTSSPQLSSSQTETPSSAASPAPPLNYVSSSEINQVMSIYLGQKFGLGDRALTTSLALSTNWAAQMRRYNPTTPLDQSVNR